MEYKIGDLVKIREDLQVGKKYGECNVIDDMLKFRGAVDTIECIDMDGDYHLANDNNPYVWNKDMLELFVPEKHLRGAKMNRLDIYQYILNNLEETYKAKNNDYGNSVADTYEKFGDLSFLVRITDKYNRLMTLCNSNAPEQRVKDEKIDDTILDLANYCLLWLVEKEYKNQGGGYSMNDVCKRLNKLTMDELIEVMAALDKHNAECSLRTVTVNNNTGYVKFMLVVDDINLLIGVLDNLGF